MLSHKELVENMFHQGNIELLITNPLLMLMHQLVKVLTMEALVPLEILAILNPESFQINIHLMCALAMLGQDMQQLGMLHQHQLDMLHQYQLDMSHLLP